MITIQHYDHTYSRIRADPGTMQELADTLTFEVPGAKFNPLVRNKVWDGKIRLLNSLTGLLYCGLSQRVEQFCRSRQYELYYDGIAADTECSLYELEQFTKSLLPSQYVPRDYQLKAAVHAIRKRRALLLSPTASGKSLIIYILAAWYAAKEDAKILVIVPTTGLVHQMAGDFESYGAPGSHIHRITAGIPKQSKCTFTVSTWQSLQRLPKEWFDQFDVVVGDEAHLYKAKSLQTIMQKLNQCQYRFGLTGTLDGTQTNKLVLEGVFGPVLQVTTTSELMDKGHVAQLKIKAIVLKHNDAVRKSARGLTYPEERDLIVSSQSRNRFITNLALSLKGNTLILFQLVKKHGQLLYDEISARAGDRKVFFINQKVDGEERDEIRAIVEQETDALVVSSFGTGSTGTNVKNLSNVIFASPSRSRVRVFQSIGRGLRTHEDKVEATLYDIADDLTWKSSRNMTLGHLDERIKMYEQEKFNYKIYRVDLK